MPAPPLTHHDILALVEPFVRAGRQVDLAASDRTARRINFKPIDHVAPVLREELVLHCLSDGGFKLVRTAVRPDATRGVLAGTGDDASALLKLFDTVPLQRHFDLDGDLVVARSYQLEPYLARSANTAKVVLRRGEAQLDGLHLAFDIPLVKGVAADISLTPGRGDTLALPQDLLAVLGWDWARLIRKQDLWISRFRLRGDSQRRTVHAEAAMRRATDHLQQVLAAPPAQFHVRHVRARWGVVLRRAIPTLAALGMIGGVFLLPRLAPNQDPGMWLALHYAPIALLAAAFMLQELPAFEIPPLPRRLRAARWRSDVGASSGSGSGGSNHNNKSAGA